MNSTKFYPDSNAFEEIRTYICPECWNKVQIIPNNLSNYSTTLHSTTPNIILARTHVSYDIICSECDGFMIECDNTFADRIIELNKLGINTRYCCEGHYVLTQKPFNFNIDIKPYKEWVDVPYVGFDIDINEYIMECIEGLLSFQEYNFIEFEATEEIYVLRAKFEFEENESINDVSIRFNDMKLNFFRFIDELIELIKYEIKEEE